MPLPRSFLEFSIRHPEGACRQGGLPLNSYLEMPSEVRTLGRRLIVFSMPYRGRLASGIYLGNPKRGSYSRTEMAWVVSCGPKVKHPLPRGTPIFLHDSFEMEETDLDLWESLRDLPEFEKLKALEEKYDGQIVTQICHESSVLCFDDAWDGHLV